MKLERMYHIAKVVYQEQHLERLDKIELVEKLMWENYKIEKDPSKKVKILSSIVDMQPYLSTYYEATKDILDSTTLSDRKVEKSVVLGSLPKSISNEPIVGLYSEPWAKDMGPKQEIKSSVAQISRIAIYGMGA